VNNKLRVYRAERGWTQAELADRAGVSRQTINVIEAGKYDPSLPLAFKLAGVFGSRIEDLFFPEEGSTRRCVPGVFCVPWMLRSALMHAERASELVFRHP
jgi:putative transcriptional regulator